MADRDLRKALDPFIQEERTGTAMVVFTDNSLGRVYLNAGTPVAARYRNTEGMEALNKCKSLDVQTVKFHENTDIVRSRQVLRSNYEVLETLNMPAEAPNQQRAAPRRAASAAEELPITGPILSPANRQRLGTLLADYIGPVAPLVMTDLPATVDVETALSIVSREIDDTQRVSEFISAARALME